MAGADVESASNYFAILSHKSLGINCHRPTPMLVPSLPKGLSYRLAPLWHSPLCFCATIIVPGQSDLFLLILTVSRHELHQKYCNYYPLEGTLYDMRYYIRHDKSAEVQGPFTVEELSKAVRAGRIPPDALASSDFGESIARLRVWRSCDWFPLEAITEPNGVVSQFPELPSQPRRVSSGTIIGELGLALWLFCTAVAEQKSSTLRWSLYVVAVLTVFSAGGTIVRYVRQRGPGSTTV